MSRSSKVNISAEIMKVQKLLEDESFHLSLHENPKEAERKLTDCITELSKARAKLHLGVIKPMEQGEIDDKL